MKRITLEPEFPPPKITVEEEIYMALKKYGPLTANVMADKTSRRSGGGITAITREMILRGLIKKRKCECKMHDIYEIIKQK